MTGKLGPHPPTEPHPPSGPCPCCGAYSLTWTAQTSALLAVCDVLVVKTLEVVGRRIVRGPGSPRSRFQSLGDRPWYLAHTLWTPDQFTTDKCLHGAWDVVPAMLDVHGCCGITSARVTSMLDGYTRDLLVTGTPHSIDQLRYRFLSHLGVPLPDPAPAVSS